MNSKEAHAARMRETARNVLQPLLDDPLTIERVIDDLQSAVIEFCPICTYKKKAATGVAPEVEELKHLDDIELIVHNPQRDGDSGDLSKRQRHVLQVLEAFYEWSDLTDEELAAETGIFHDSAKATRAALVAGGWIQATDRKRQSQNNRPMTVWKLTDRALRHLAEVAAA